MEEGKKFDVEFKQTAKGSWYLGSLKVGADSIEELDQIIDSTVIFLHTKLDKMNNNFHENIDGNIDQAPRSAIRFRQATQPDLELSYDEKRLFERLRSMRMDLARAENIPPYMIAHDSVLKRLAKTKPGSKEEMICIEGIGEKNFEKHGIYFLKVIKDSSPQKIPLSQTPS